MSVCNNIFEYNEREPERIKEYHRLKSHDRHISYCILGGYTATYDEGLDLYSITICDSENTICHLASVSPLSKDEFIEYVRKWVVDNEKEKQ